MGHELRCCSGLKDLDDNNTTDDERWWEREGGGRKLKEKKFMCGNEMKDEIWGDEESGNQKRKWRKKNGEEDGRRGRLREKIWVEYFWKNEDQRAPLHFFIAKNIWCSSKEHVYIGNNWIWEASLTFLYVVGEVIWSLQERLMERKEHCY